LDRSVEKKLDIATTKALAKGREITSASRVLAAKKACKDKAQKRGQPAAYKKRDLNTKKTATKTKRSPTRDKRRE